MLVKVSIYRLGLFFTAFCSKITRIGWAVHLQLIPYETSCCMVRCSIVAK